MSTAATDRAPHDPAHRTPKYYLVKQHLLEVIDALPPGRRIPTERVLSAELGTSRTTVRQALIELVGEGHLMRRQGSGTYVADPKIGWPPMTSFRLQAPARGLMTSVRLQSAERIRAPEDLAHRLTVRNGASVFRIQRLRMDDATPIAVETAYLSATRFPGLIKQVRRDSAVHRVLAQIYGVVVASAEETIEAATASPRESDLLNIDTGAPMLVLGRQSFDTDGQPVEWVTSWYRGDRCTFVARLTGTNLPADASAAAEPTLARLI